MSREVTNWLIPPGGLYTAMQSFFQQEPTIYHVETLADAQLFTLSYPNYRTLMKTYPEVGLKIFEQVIVMADARVKMCNLRDPQDRLRMFEATHGEMKKYLSVNVLASYLNVDPNTLSRIRAKRK